VFGIFRAKEQCDGALLGCSRELLDVLALIIELRGVSFFELLPAIRVVSESLSQLGAGSDFFEPFIDTRFSFR